MSPSLKKIAIACFCIFHMFAVALYAIPNVVKEDPFIQLLQEHFNDSVRPYMFATSQWQSWPLFAPDPLRRVTRIRIDIREEGEWRTIPDISDEGIAWWRYSKEIKLMDRLNRDGREEIQKRYLTLHCSRIGIPPYVPIRLRFAYYIIPKHRLQRSLEWWHEWEPEWQESVKTTTTCPYVARA